MGLGKLFISLTGNKVSFICYNNYPEGLRILLNLPKADLIIAIRARFRNGIQYDINHILEYIYDVLHLRVIRSLSNHKFPFQ